MKSLLLIPTLALALCASACRTMTPLDPMTMKPTERCLPEHFPARTSVYPTK